MELSIDIIQMLKKSGTRVTPFYPRSSVDICEEWIKWLSYVPDFEIDGIDKQLKMSKLFEKYGTHNITESEYLEVYTYMKNNSVEDLMESKLTKEELEEARKYIKKYSSLSKEDLLYIISVGKTNYKIINMVEAYILHEISTFSYRKNVEDLDNEIKNDIKNNAYMSHKSLYLASDNKKRFN